MIEGDVYRTTRRLPGAEALRDHSKCRLDLGALQIHTTPSQTQVVWLSGLVTGICERVLEAVAREIDGYETNITRGLLQRRHA